jgi:TPR repeat protein
MSKTLIVFSLFLSLVSCQKKDMRMAKLPDLDGVRSNLAFTCTQESKAFPVLDPEADQFFKYARYLEKKSGSKDFNDVARYYRIAAAYGHYKANGNLQQLISEGRASSPDNVEETIALASQLIDQGIPGGHYDIGHYLEAGYGFKQDKEMALRYFRKAADLGSPEAQFYIARLLAPLDKAPEIAVQMYRCAMSQGLGKAGSILGIHLQVGQLYSEAVQAFQKGAAGGSSQAASFLEDAFKGPPSSNELDYLALTFDAERSWRYQLIWEFLIANEGRNPKVPDIDQIVPLPPAKLPDWDGTFQWQKEQDAAPIPEKPSDELIQRLCKEKNLDPATGLPLPAPEKAAQEKRKQARKNLVVGSGEECPESGYWCSQRHAEKEKNIRHYFLAGEIMPSVAVHHPRSPAWMKYLIGERREVIRVSWKRETDDEQQT